MAAFFCNKEDDTEEANYTHAGVLSCLVLRLLCIHGCSADLLGQPFPLHIWLETVSVIYTPVLPHDTFAIDEPIKNPRRENVCGSLYAL